MNWIKQFVDFLIPKELLKDQLIIKKARMLTWVHLLWILGGIVMAFAYNSTVGAQSAFPTLKVIFFGLLIAGLFKQFGNFDLSANLLAIGIASILIPMVEHSGGLFSDNLLWLVFCPMIVSLFGTKRIDIVWYVLVMLFICYQFYLSSSSGVNRSAVIDQFPHVYYMVSYILFATLVMGIVWTFKHGNISIFLTLQRQQKAIEKKHMELLISNKKLNEATNLLSRSNKELEAFASIASHDLKEPLRMITMYAQLLKKRLGNDLTQEQAEFMMYINEGTSHMQKLLDDILDYSKVGRSNERVKLVDLDDVVYYVQKILVVSITETNAKIVVLNPLPEIIGRYSELVQVFQNLLANAIKFRAEGVTPIIELDSVVENDFYVISFKDNGIGIEDRYKEKVFEMFERLHSRTEYAGTGIGLALCSKVVQQLGGQIWLESELNKGTTFFIKLPRTQPVLTSDSEKQTLL
jgi:signal transduction histidine kinase